MDLILIIGNYMSIKKIILGSQQYSPIYKSHCCAFGKLCDNKCYDVKYLFSHGYERMLENSIKEKMYFMGAPNYIFSAIVDS